LPQRDAAEKKKERRIMKTITNMIYLVIAVACFALLPHADAVNPPPDGGYPGGNAAEGQAAPGRS